MQLYKFGAINLKFIHKVLFDSNYVYVCGSKMTKLTFNNSFASLSLEGISYDVIPNDCADAGPEERVITLDEVSWHDTLDDCWIVIYDRVYDITDFQDEVSHIFNFRSRL